MIVDAHLHCSGKETSAGILAALDEAQVDIGLLLAPFLNDPYSLSNPDSLRAANGYLSKLIRGHEDRLIGFAVINPLHETSIADLDDAVNRLGLRGLKLVPSGWYPYDDCAHRVYDKAVELQIPILFHAGIFIDGRSGRFCRPVFYEAVRDHPGLKVTLAHLGWPWTDEAIAVGLIELINGVSPENCSIRFDISFGPPPIYRQPVFERALSVLGSEMLQFGSDRFCPCHGSHIRSAIEEVNGIFDALSVPILDRAKIMGQNAARWLGLLKS